MDELQFLNNTIKDQKKQNLHLWYDEEKSKYFIIDNETGQAKQVTKACEPIKKFDASLTGRYSYHERLKHSKGQKELMPCTPKSLKINDHDIYYKPSYGYGQYPSPSPLSKLFETNIRIEKNKDRINKLINFAKKAKLEFNSPKNEILFKKINQSFNDRFDNKNQFEGSFRLVNLDNTNINTQTTSNASSVLDLTNSSMEYTSMKNNYDSKRVMKPTLGDALKIEADKTMKEKFHRRFIESPHLAQYSIRTKSVKDEYDVNNKDDNEKSSKCDRLYNEMQFNTNINTVRYTNKINSSLNKSNIFMPHNDKETEKLIETYMELHEKLNKSVDLQGLSDKIGIYDIQTFDKKIILNTENTDRKYNNAHDLIKYEKHYLERKRRESLELKATDVMTPRKSIQDKPVISLRGKFKSCVPSPGDQYKMDRELMKKVSPELFFLKENKSISMKAARLTKNFNINNKEQCHKFEVIPMYEVDVFMMNRDNYQMIPIRG